VIFFWGLRLSPIDPQSASLKKVKPRWGTLFHCPEKTSDSSTLHLLRCFLPRGAGCEPENLLLELRLPHFNLWIFFKSSSPLHLRSCVSCRFCTRRLNGVPHLWVRGRQRLSIGLISNPGRPFHAGLPSGTVWPRQRRPIALAFGYVHCINRGSRLGMTW
jgi:hypothetical protein